MWFIKASKAMSAVERSTLSTWSTRASQSALTWILWCCRKLQWLVVTVHSQIINFMFSKLSSDTFCKLSSARFAWLIKLIVKRQNWVRSSKEYKSGWKKCKINESLWFFIILFSYKKCLILFSKSKFHTCNILSFATQLTTIKFTSFCKNDSYFVQLENLKHS